MRKLDLSLDIPDAPYILCVQGSNGLDPQREPAGLRNGVAAQSDDWRREFVPRGPVSGGGGLRALPSAQTKMAVNQMFSEEVCSMRAEGQRIRQKMCESWQHLDPAQTLVVRPAATLSGDVVCHSLRLQGELRGSLMASGWVHVQPEAVFNGIIQRSDMVIVEGTVAGLANALAIRCNGLVVLAKSARVVGHIQCRSVAIYEGASVVGTIQALA